MQLPVGGQQRTFSVFLAPFPENQEQHVLCVFHDISLLQEMAARQADFTANAAHELATPLTSISGFAETLLDDDFSAPEQSRKCITTIYNEAQRMNQRLQTLKASPAFRAPFAADLPAGPRQLQVRDISLETSYPWPRTFEIYLQTTLWVYTLPN